MTYWTVVGDQQRPGRLGPARCRRSGTALKGEIVDGLLFRVSSRDRNSDQAFALQAGFIRDIVAAMAPQAQAAGGAGMTGAAHGTTA